MALEKESTPVSAAAAAGANVPPLASSELGEKKHSKKRKKRQRGQKAKMRVVTAIGEESRDRRLGKGQVRQLDILRGNPDSTKLPRKTRELLARMNKFNSGQNAFAAPKAAGISNGQITYVQKNDEGTAGGPRTSHSKVNVSGQSLTARGQEGEPLASALQEKNDSQVKQKSKKRKFDGMQPGENFAQFSARLRKESKQMLVDTARKGNRQREKKRAYYEKQKERAMRKKRRRGGNCSESDVEDDAADDWDESKSIAHLPSYWQEILQNNGKPISAKRKKRLAKAQEQSVDNIAFGEQAERPPEFSVLPVRRGGKAKSSVG